MNRSRFFIICLLLLSLSAPAHAGFFDDISGLLGLSAGTGESLSDSTIVKGLKEALSTGTARAVTLVSRQDGYFSNETIKILMPDKMRTVADLLARFGFRQEVDDFVLSMNRAAEKAAPKATEYFVTALKEMTFDDARKIVQGDSTAATEYFRQKTGDKIRAAFKPVVSESMQDVGVTRSYKQLVEKVETIPFAGAVGSLDLDQYVAAGAVNGLFTMLGEEEKKIRTDPAARGTELLRKVFGRQ
jgi:hypothetical protein